MFSAFRSKQKPLITSSLSSTSYDILTISHQLTHGTMSMYTTMLYKKYLTCMCPIKISLTIITANSMTHAYGRLSQSLIASFDTTRDYLQEVSENFPYILATQSLIILTTTESSGLIWAWDIRLFTLKLPSKGGNYPYLPRLTQWVSFSVLSPANPSLSSLK